jgi:hypothetical protein
VTATIAEERLVALRPSGERVRIVAAIGAPYEVGPEEWACPVSLAGLHERLHAVHGGSSLQALCLAASVLRQLLTSFVEDGGRLLYEDGTEPFNIASCFSGIGLQ